MRQSWTDERLDEGFDRFDDRFDRWQRMTFSMLGGLMIALLGIVLANSSSPYGERSLMVQPSPPPMLISPQSSAPARAT